MTLHAHIDLPDPAELPETAGRTVYRVIQEGLTNARKHAPGTPVQVTVTAQGQAVTAEIITRRRPGLAGPGAAAPAGAGAGLIGLTERVTLAGGQLDYGPNAIGDFVLRATIPRQP
jgi:signal transduction histidine kinase